MKQLLLITILISAGCVTKVQRTHVDDNTVLITANARCTAEHTIAADGTETFKIDTMSQSLLDKIKAALNNMINYIGRALDNVEPEV